MRLQVNLTPAHLFTLRGRRKRGFLFFKIALGATLASAKWKKFNGKPDRINELILKTKVDMKERPDNICFVLLNWLSYGDGGEGFV